MTPKQQPAIAPGILSNLWMSGKGGSGAGPLSGGNPGGKTGGSPGGSNTGLGGGGPKK